MSRRTAWLRAIAAVAAIAVMGLAVSPAAGALRPSVWIDQPLPGALLPFGSTAVTVHAADPSGIASVRFLVDGDEAGEVSAASGDLVTVAWTWVPTSAGPHLLTVLAVADGGGVPDPVSAGVSFTDGRVAPPTAEPTTTPGPTSTASSTATPTAPSATAKPTPTPKLTPRPTATPKPTPTPKLTPRPTATPKPTPTATPKPTPTSTPKPTPTPAPCAPPMPDALNPPDGYQALPADNPPTFTWAYRVSPSCAPGGFKISIVDGASTYSVSSGNLSSSTRSWTPRAALPYGRSCTRYLWTFDVLRSDKTAAHSVTRSVNACP